MPRGIGQALNNAAKRLAAHASSFMSELTASNSSFEVQLILMWLRLIRQFQARLIAPQFLMIWDCLGCYWM